MPYADWYKTSSANLACTEHPGPSKELIKAVTEYTGLAQCDAEHVLDRVRHLARCLGEPPAITLLRLQPGSNQEPRVLPSVDER